MNYRVEIYKKSGEKTTFKRLIKNLVIDRRLDMGTTSANINIINEEDKKLTRFDYMGAIIDNYNKVKIYINNKIQFTGIIKNYDISEDNKIIKITCHDLYSKLLKLIDCGKPYILYKNIKATAIIKDLVKKAGIDNMIFDIDKTKDYTVKELKVKYDAQYSDVINEVLATLEARAEVLKDGTFKVEKIYPNYKMTDVKNNINYDWYYEDFIKVSSASSKRSTETLYNRVLIRYNEKIYNVFEEPMMIKYLAGEKRLKEVNSPLADTIEKRHIVANRFFLDTWRKNTNLDIVATKGNVDLNLGQVMRLKLAKDILGHYIVLGIRTELINDGSYIDYISLEGMRENLNIAKISTGNYTVENESGHKKKSDETYINVNKNIPIIFKINSKGRTKLGYTDIDKENYLEISTNFKSLLETKHYDLIIQDPNKKYYGYKQQILNDNKSSIVLNKISSCKSISYSGWEALTEYFKIYNPMPGRWYIYLESDIVNDYNANIIVNKNWKKVRI